MTPRHPAQFDNLDEVDPLLAFGAESPAAKFPEKAPNPTSPPAEDAALVVQRLAQAEQSLERARLEIASLKSDLGTLVGAVDDIKKRLRRRPEVVTVPAPALVPHRSGFSKAAAMVILLVTLGAAIWGATAAVALIKIPVPLPVDTESSPVDTDVDTTPAPKPPVVRVRR